MAKKKPKKDGIYFTGKASDEVTGSQYLINWGNYKCLLECGLHQSSSNSYLDSYKVNSEKFCFNPKEINYVFIAHPHIDHCGLLPRLVKEGFNGKIIATRATAIVMKSLLLNSCYILKDETRVLSKRYKRDYKPIYEEEDVYRCLDMIQIYDEFEKIFKLNENISFQWLKNSHCIGAAQLRIILKNETKVRKILYTSDLGSLKNKNHYLTNTIIPTMFNDITIMESTYGNSKRQNRKLRDTDIEHLRVAINTVLERKGSIIFPCFSFSRTQEILATLYDMYGNDDCFNTSVVIDSKLSCEITNLYSSIVDKQYKNDWLSVYQWKNIKYISEKTDSQKCLADNSPKIILSSSGFCTNGRIVNYLKKYLKDANSMIIFTGYTGDNPSYLSYRIKNYRTNKSISINKENILNKADCISLSSFSSHANYNDLIEFGSSLSTNKLILVHGDADSKKCLSEGLQNAISKNDKTYRVICATRGLFVHI